MSKRLKNYPDPVEVIDKYGADALRLYMINSPVVKGEELRFKEAGVKEIVSKVLLPLYNSYNFFKDQVSLLQKFEQVEFTFDPKAETTNTNVMDRWILASTQTLLEYVNAEMAGYRLYTVVPGLLELLEDTTNWYIKFNRKRFKGELGRDDTIHALNTLFEVLFTLVRALAPFTPFVTDMIYQKLLPFIPKSLHGEDMRSVHFLPFPEVRSELKDPIVERRISRMRSIIELVRQSRERRTVSLRTPLKTLVVIHNDQEYLDDIKSLEGYITEELNLRDLVLSSDETKYNVQYSVALNFQKVGKKLRGDAKKVQKGLLELNSSDCKGYLSTGKIEVAGVVLEEGDLIVKRGLPQDDKASETQETNGDNEVLTILDVGVYPELAQEGLAREIIARVQQLRKKAGLKTTDDVKMEYRVKADPQNIGIASCFEQQGAFIEKALRRPVDKHVVTEVEPVQNGVKEDVIVEEDQEVQDATFLLRLVRL